MHAEINGTAITLGGGPTEFTAVVNPGPPLRDDNMLHVGAKFGGRAVSLDSTFAYLPPKAVARRIDRDTDLIHGPLAHGRVGDYLLANAVARFVIQDVGKRDLYSVGTFGGNIIDAELTAHPGLDNFIEIQPALNIETVINAQQIEIVNDGQDGLPAIIRTCGPDDTLDFINPSTTIEDEGIVFPASANDKDYDIDACTEYSLPPEKSFLKMETTVHNNEADPLGLFVGDYINAGGELDTWAKSLNGIGETLAGTLDTLSYIGVGEASGVDYSIVPIPSATQTALRDGYLTTNGVTYLLHAQGILQAIVGAVPVFFVPAQGQNSFTRYFGVGNGNGGSAVAIENELRGYTTGKIHGCVDQSGQPAPGTRVSVFQHGLAANYTADSNGCYDSELSVGAYRVGASRRGSPFEGNGTLPVLHDVTINADATTEQDITLPSTGHVHVQVAERRGGGALPDLSVPARITVVGFDPSVDPTVTTTVLLTNVTTGVFSDVTGDPLPYGTTWVDYTGADGTADFDLEPGTYQLYVSRGSEYSVYSEPLIVTPDATNQISATLVRVIDTPGFVSSDLHLHGIRSVDSRINDDDRVRQCAGEGVEHIVLTDHNARGDLAPRVTARGLDPFLHATVGEEMTTWDYGHFGTYPVTVDPQRPSGGSIDWAGAAPPGRDFVAYGAYDLAPNEIEQAALSAATSTPDALVQINHVQTHFAPLRIDTTQVPPHSPLSPAERLNFRLDPNGGELFHNFPALELWSGADIGDQGTFVFSTIGIWFNLLNQGLLSTFVSGTDAHGFHSLDSAGPRTWTASSTDDPAQISAAEVSRSVRDGKAVVGQGIYVQTRLLAADGSAGVADFSLNGSTTVSSSNGTVDLEINVQAPLWAEYEVIEIFANAPTIATRLVNGTPVLFSASPTRVLQLRRGGFRVDTVAVDPSVPGASRLETHQTVRFADLTQDTWFVVVVRGITGFSHPMFPIFPQDLDAARNKTLADLLDGNLNEDALLSLGATNALFADVDGVPGFQAPITSSPTH